MPDILPVMAMPAAPAAPVSAVAPASSQPADPDAGGGGKFLAQLKTALATLAGAAVARAPSRPAADAPPAQEQAPAREAAPADAEAPQPSDKPADHASDGLPDVLAALGVVLAPVSASAQPIAEPKDAHQADPSGGGAAPIEVGPHAAGPRYPAESAPQPASQPVQPDAASTDDKPEPTAEPAMAPRPAESAQHPFVQHTPDRPVSSSASHKLAQISSPAQTDPRLNTATTNADVEARPSPASDAAVVAPAQPRQHTRSHLEEPRPAQPLANAERTSVPTVNGEHSFGDGNGNPSYANGEGQPSTGKDESPAPVATREVVEVDAEAPAATGSPSGATAAASAAAHAASSTGGAALPANAPRPTEVVNQIAHQSELYRLPGNRGVRIQLHPEELGGVDVTLRYSTNGGIQLHINVEHATTGALVQAGWAELRDALSTQDITPDRLVMSISGPNDARGMDFSGGGGARSDQGLAAWTQDQSGQRRQDPGDQSVVNGWNGAAESPSPTDELPRSAATSASSRIDYRV